MAHVEWNVQQNNRTTTYSSHEQYLDSQTVLFGVIDGPTETYPAGEHSYDFAVALPDRLPGTMKAKDAVIKYKVRVVMDVPWAIDNRESQAFSVANVVDLNQNNALRVAVHLEEMKSFCIFSLGYEEEAVVSASVPQGGYTAHEVIPIQCRIHNKTSVSFGSISIELQRKVTATATSPRTSVREYDFKEAETEHVFSEDTRNTTTGVTATIKVPECPVSSNFAAYIRTEYVLRLQFNVIGCHKNVILRLPIEIGTIAMGAPGYAASGLVPMASSHLPTAPEPEKEPLLEERKCNEAKRDTWR